MDYLKMAMKSQEHMSQLKKKEEEEKLKKMAEQGIVPEKNEPYYDSVNTLENSEALVLYIIVMAIGSIFVDRWWIWIGATIAYLCFKTRHRRRK